MATRLRSESSYLKSQEGHRESQLKLAQVIGLLKLASSVILLPARPHLPNLVQTGNLSSSVQVIQHVGEM